jgi:putative transposase
MPSRNILKEYAPESYYHVYARGSSKQKIFLDASDYHYFTGLFERYLGVEQKISKTGEPYPNFNKRVKLISYCLMSNHFHLLVYQEDIDDLQFFMRSIMTSYCRYFNLKYKKSGSLFESRYKASRINSDQYLEHISRYIHLNPRRWDMYFNSSFKFYKDGGEPEWLSSVPILDLFSSRGDYVEFVADFEESRDMLAEMKYELADQ